MNINIDNYENIPECNCREREEKTRGHIMGCAYRTRVEAIAHFEYEKSLKNVQTLLENFP
jgi:hypothetical protein